MPPKKQNNTKKTPKKSNEANPDEKVEDKTPLPDANVKSPRSPDPPEDKSPKKEPIKVENEYENEPSFKKEPSIKKAPTTRKSKAALAPLISKKSVGGRESVVLNKEQIKDQMDVNDSGKIHNSKKGVKVPDLSEKFVDKKRASSKNRKSNVKDQVLQEDERSANSL